MTKCLLFWLQIHLLRGKSTIVVYNFPSTPFISAGAPWRVMVMGKSVWQQKVSTINARGVSFGLTATVQERPRREVRKDEEGGERKRNLKGKLFPRNLWIFSHRSLGFWCVRRLTPSRLPTRGTGTTGKTHPVLETWFGPALPSSRIDLMGFFIYDSISSVIIRSFVGDFFKWRMNKKHRGDLFFVTLLQLLSPP